jgi:diketogulonate reductase-like aldo/keto reductase
MKLDYVDLFLVHWPIAAEKDGQEKPKIGPDGKVKRSFPRKAHEQLPINLL